MTKRLRLTRNRSDSSGDQIIPKPAKEKPDSGSQGFSLHFAGGSGILRLEGEQLGPALRLDLLEMAIPKIGFPFDVSQGIMGLRNKRHKLVRLKLSVSLSGLLEHIRARLEENSWIDNVRIAIEDDSLSTLLEYGPPGSKVLLSFRLLPSSGDRRCALLLDDVWAFGPVPVSLLLAAVTVLRELANVSMDGVEFVPPDPVKFALMNTMPRRGWRLPSHDGVTLTDFKMLPSRVELEFSVPDGVTITSGNTTLGMTRLRRLEELRLTRDGDRLLAKGEIEEARTAYSRLLEREPDSTVSAVRLAMIDVMDYDMRDTALALILEVAGSESKRPDVRAVLAHGASMSGNISAEIASLDELFHKGLPFERLAAGLRIGRLLIADYPERAVPYFEGALSARREDPDAMSALLEACAATGHRDKVEKLIPRWIALHRNSGDRVKAYLKIGRLLLEDLKDGAGALKNFERASMADPSNNEAAWGLADALGETGEVQRAISQYERLARLCREKDDPQGVARAIKSIGKIWMSAGDLQLAIPRFREALTLALDKETSSLRLLLAEALMGLKQYAEAAAELEITLNKASPDQEGFPWGDTAVKLAALYMNVLDDFDAAEIWIRAAEKVGYGGSAAGTLLREMLERQGRWPELIIALERLIIVEPTKENALDLVRARLKTGEFSAAVNTLEELNASHPNEQIILELTIEACRGAGDFVKLKDALQKQFNQSSDISHRAIIAEQLGDIELKTFENPSDAISWYQTALNDEPDFMEARVGLTEALKRLQRNDLLDEQLKILAESYGRRDQRSQAAGALVERAELKLAAGQPSIAAELLRRALPDLQTEDRRKVLIKIADLYLSLEDFKSAKDMFGAARREIGEGGNHYAAIGEAETALKLKDYEAAFEAAVAAGSGPSELRLRAAKTAALAAVPLGKFKEAAEILLRIGENAAPQEGAELIILAAEIVSEHLGQPERSEQILEQLIEETPDNLEAKKALVSLLEQRGDRVSLARGLVRFVEDNKRDAPVLKQAADFFCAENMFDEAADALKRAYEATNDAETARMYAKVLHRSGKDEQMLKVLAKYADHDEPAREMMILRLTELDRHKETAALIENHPGKSPMEERVRLRRLAVIQSKFLGDYADATRSLIKALDLEGADGKSWEMASDAIAFAEKTGDPGVSAEAIVRMISIAPDEEKSRWMFLMGGALWCDGNIQESRTTIGRALELDKWTLDDLAAATRKYPQCDILVKATAEKAAADGDWPLTEEMLGASIAQATGEESSHLLRKRAAIRRMRLGNVDGAIEDMLQAKLNGSMPKAELEELIVLLENKGDLSTAAKIAYESAFESRDLSKLAHAARLNNVVGNQGASVKLWREAISLNPEPSSIISLIKLLNPKEDGDEIDRLLEMLRGREDLLDIPDHMFMLETEVELELARGQELAAVESLAVMMNIDPARNDPWKKMVHILEHRGEWSALAKRMEERLMLSAAPDDMVKTAMSLGILLEEKMGDENGAVAAFEQVISIYPEHPKANLALAKIAYGRRQWANLDKYLASLKEMDWSIDMALWRAAAAENMGRKQAALEEYRILINKNPEMSQAVEGLMRLSDSNDADTYDEIISAAENLIERVGADQVKADIHRRAGIALIGRSRLDEALERLIFADTLCDGDPKSLRVMAELHAKASRHRERAEVLNKLAFLVDDNERTSCLVDAASIYLDKLDDSKMAYRLLSNVAEVDRDHPDVLLGLADSAWLNGDLVVVAKNLERYSLVAPGSTLDSEKRYRFAAALNHTQEWPKADIIEMLEQAIGELEGARLIEAVNLLGDLKEG